MVKILEILREDGSDTEHSIPDVTIPQRTSKTYGIEAMRTHTNALRGELGSGAHATAHAHPKDPTKIVKYADIHSKDPKQDAYVQYVNMVSKHKNNPFFPRIHNAKLIYHPESDNNTLVVVMERLQPLADMWDMNEKLLHSATEMIKRLGVELVDPVESAFSLSNYLQDEGVRRDLRGRTKNPQFKEALELMEPFFKKHWVDLHNENFMVRLTGHGPQLVFVDPFESDD